jgi:hypothetical protein
MTLIRVFPRCTKATPDDALAFVGDPPMMVPECSEVHVSVTFTWDLAEGERLLRAWRKACPWAEVKIGGPALGDPGADFVPGRYLKSGYVITSRGCPNKCGFCLVPKREGALREIPVMPGHDEVSNNLLACSDSHLDRVFEMFAVQRKAIRFSGGLESRRVTPAVVERLRSVTVDELFLAYDHPSSWGSVAVAIARLRDAGLRHRAVRCYILAGMAGDTVDEAEGRCRQVFEQGAVPFLMLWQPDDGHIDYPREWRELQRTWTRPAATFAHMRSGEAPVLSQQLAL